MNKYKLIVVSNPYGKLTNDMVFASIKTRTEGRKLMRTFGFQGSHSKGVDKFYKKRTNSSVGNDVSVMLVRA